MTRHTCISTFILGFIPNQLYVMKSKKTPGVAAPSGGPTSGQGDQCRSLAPPRGPLAAAGAAAAGAGKPPGPWRLPHSFQHKHETDRGVYVQGEYMTQRNKILLTVVTRTTQKTHLYPPIQMTLSGRQTKQ